MVKVMHHAFYQNTVNPLLMIPQEGTDPHIMDMFYEQNWVQVAYQFVSNYLLVMIMYLTGTKYNSAKNSVEYSCKQKNLDITTST